MTEVSFSAVILNFLTNADTSLFFALSDAHLKRSDNIYRLSFGPLTGRGEEKTTNPIVLFPAVMSSRVQKFTTRRRNTYNHFPRQGWGEAKSEMKMSAVVSVFQSEWCILSRHSLNPCYRCFWSHSKTQLWFTSPIKSISTLDFWTWRKYSHL